MAVRYFYVDSNNGTNTGTTDTSYASLQTGAMSALTASNVYDRIGRVSLITSPPIDGDFILIANNHSVAYDNTNNVSLNGGIGATSGGIKVISVLNTAIDTYTPGASESLNDGSDDYAVAGAVGFYGVSLGTGDDVIRFNSSGAILNMQDATLTVSNSSGDAGIYTPQDGCLSFLTNVTIAGTGAASNVFNLRSGCSIYWRGGSLSGTIAAMQDQDFINGGGLLDIDGVDLSAYTGVLMPATTAGTDDCVTVIIRNCKIGSTTLHGTLGDAMHRFEMYNCDTAAGGKFYRFYFASGSGSVSNNDSTYVTATESWYEGSDKSSMEVITTALCSNVTPFIFELPAQYVDLSQAASNVLTLELTTDLTLTDTDIAAFLVYPDGTTAVQANWVTSGKTVGTGNYGIDPLAAGTTLTTGSLGAGDWTGEPTSPNFYKMVLDTSGDAGQATAVSIRIEVYKASIAAGKLFIHPLLTLS